MMIWQSGQCLVVSVKRKMDRIVCLSKTSSGQVFTISDKINVSLTNLHQKKGFNKDISASHLYKRLVEETYRKKRVWIHFMETWYWRFTRQKYPVHTNFFMGPDPIFFCSVNRALRMLTAILSGLLIFHAVADPRNSGISAKYREICQKYFRIHVGKTYLILILAIRPVLFTPNVQIYLETSSLQRVNNVPKLPGVLRLMLQKTGH